MNLNDFVDITFSFRLCSSHLLVDTRTFSAFLLLLCIVVLSLCFLLKMPPWICCFLSWSHHVVVIELLSASPGILGFLDSPHVTSICTSVSDRNVLFLFWRTDRTNNWRKNMIFFLFFNVQVLSCLVLSTFSHSFYFEMSFFLACQFLVFIEGEKVFVECFSS